MRLATAVINKEEQVLAKARKLVSTKRRNRNPKKVRKMRAPEPANNMVGEEVMTLASRETRGENIVLEIKALLGICRDTPDSRDMLSKLEEAHFHSEAVQMPFKRLRFLYSRTGMIPDFQTLMNDPSVSAAARERLNATIAAYEITAPATSRQFGGLFTAIDSYAKKRQVFDALNSVADVMRVDGTDAETAIARFKREALRLESGFKSGTINTTGGGADAGPENSDLEAVARRNLSHVDTLNPTGFHAYDRINGGFPEAGLILLGADTGNFKSVKMLEHAIGQAKQGKRVAFYSLEMTENQLYDRVFANQISLDVLKERREGTMIANLERNVQRVIADMANWWPNWTLVCPAEDVSWDWIAEHASSTDAEIVYVDYIGLLSGTNGSGSEAQWQAMNSVTRNAKIYTNKTKRTVVLAAQMKFEDGKPSLKYATAMKDHCLTGDTLIDTGRGIIPFDSIVNKGGPRQPNVMPIVTNSNILSATSHFHDNGVKPVWQLKLHDGRTITGTKNHEFLILQSDMTTDWKAMGELRPGDYVITARNTHFAKAMVELQPYAYTGVRHHNSKHTEKFPRKFDTRLAYMVGLLLADGHFNPGSRIISWVNSDESVITKLKGYADALFGKDVFQIIGGTTPQGTPYWRLRSTRQDVLGFFSNISGLIGGSSGKYIPDEIMRSPKKVVAACIQGMMDGDGCNDGSIIHYTSCSRTMIERLQLLLDKFAIVSNIRERPHFEGKLQAYQLQLSAASGQKYIQEIGFTAPRKQDRGLAHGSRSRLRDVVYPFINDLLLKPEFARDVRRGQVSKSSRIRQALGVSRGCKVSPRHITKGTIHLVHEIDRDLGSRLKNLVERDYQFSQVESVTYVGKRRVYDLTVPVTHNYVANGVVSHNCNIMLAWEALIVDDRTFLCVHVDKARGGRKFHYVMEVEPEYSRIRDIAPNDKRGTEIAEQAIADMRARRDPSKRYQSVNDAKPHKTHSPEDHAPKRTFDGVKVIGGGFTGQVKSYNVSPHDEANDEAPWETHDEDTSANDRKRQKRREAMSNVASSLADTFARQAERKAAQQTYAIDKRKALAALTKNKTAGLSREQMAMQAEELLAQWELGRDEATYGFNVLAKDIVAMQATLGGLRQTVDAAKHPELALTLSNERDKRFAKRASPEERELHRKRIAFVKAAIEKRDAKRKRKEKLRITDLIMEAPKRLANDGTNLFDVADASTLTRDWTINAVTFEDRASSTTPNSAKPVAKRWKLNQRDLSPALSRINKYRTKDQAKLVQLHWPKVERLHYLTDAQLDHMVQLTNKWHGVPLVQAYDQPDYRSDLATWAEFVTPSNRPASKRAVELTEKQYAAIAAKYQMPARNGKESSNGEVWKTNPLATRYGQAIAQRTIQSVRRRIAATYGEAPQAISYRKVAA